MTNILWDARFLQMAWLASTWSKDPSTKVGAIIVRDDKTIGSFGYNGFPRGVEDYQERYDNRELKYSYTVHAEINAILNAHGGVKNDSIYIWPFMSCSRCAGPIIQSGIKNVISVKTNSEAQARWKDTFDDAKKMFDEAGVEWFEYDMDEIKQYWASL